ncbi:MAG: lactate utilization protein [Bacillota bacterium]
MDEYLNEVLEQRINRTIEGLEKNNMKGYFAKDKESLIEVIKGIINENDIVSFGGSMTLFETNILDFLRQGSYRLLDRYEEGLSDEDIKELYRKSFSADAYFTSTNAITEDGKLYNVDGRGNRVAAMIYGPDKVIVIAGVNKIVKDIDQAIKRNKVISAPANTKRLSIDAPCRKIGKCVDCDSEYRICNKYTVIRKEFVDNRMHVILLNENLGY